MAAAGLLERSFEEFTHVELLELLTDVETVSWQLPAVGHRVIARLQREASPVELGATSLTAVLVQRLRISGRDAAGRLAEWGRGAASAGSRRTESPARRGHRARS